MTLQVRAAVLHVARVARSNAQWHRKKWRETRDRYYLGQWKAYHRVALRLSDLEVFRRP